jgi:purine-binding chemotaxis protein CheW
MADATERRVVLGFTLGEQFCGLPIEDVQEVLQLVELTPVTDAPPFVAGALDLRGSVLPVIDLATLVGAVAPTRTLDTPIIVSRSGGQAVGLITDAVHDVIEFADSDVDEATQAFGMRGLLSGVVRTAQGLMMLFDLRRVLELASGGLAVAGEARPS